MRSSSIGKDSNGAAAEPTVIEVRRSGRPQAEAARYAVPLALLSLVGLSVGMLLYATTPLGAGLETDAVNYLSAAGSLTRGAGYLGWDGQVLSWFPPAYPLVIALLSLVTGSGVEQAAQATDVALFSGLVLATYALACRVISSPAIRLLVTASVASSPLVLGVYDLISSETLFNFLCVAALVLVCVVSTSPPGSSRYRVTFGLLAAISASAVMARLAGVALVLSVAITIVMVARPTQRLTARASTSLGFCVLAMAPITAWAVFLHSLTGSWSFGNRGASTSAFTDNIRTLAQTLGGWTSPPSVIFTGWVWLDLVAAAVTLAALVTALLELFKRPATRLRTVAPVLVFCLVYPAFLLLVSSITDLVGALDDRYLSPLLVPLVVLLGFGIEMAWLNTRRYGWLGRGLALAIIGAVLLSLASSMVRSARDVQQGHIQGISGVRTTNWNNMGVLRAARSLPAKDGELLFSNLPEMMTYSTGSVYQYPPNRGGGVPDDLRQLVQAHVPVYLVVLTLFDDSSLYTPAELAQWFTVRSLYSGPDGQLVELSDH